VVTQAHSGGPLVARWGWRRHRDPLFDDVELVELGASYSDVATVRDGG
jgi:hypothetical protein